jgi:hypothetical protein
LETLEQVMVKDDVRGPMFAMVCFEELIFMASWNYSIEVYGSFLFLISDEFNHSVKDRVCFRVSGC